MERVTCRMSGLSAWQVGVRAMLVFLGFLAISAGTIVPTFAKSSESKVTPTPSPSRSIKAASKHSQSKGKHKHVTSKNSKSNSKQTPVTSTKTKGKITEFAVPGIIDAYIVQGPDKAFWFSESNAIGR